MNPDVDLPIDYKDIENIVFNDRIPEEIKEGKLRTEGIISFSDPFSDPLYNDYLRMTLGS